MLKNLQINNFRAFRSFEEDFSKINIFVGPNNSGKSSIISAINLIAQNVRRGRQSFTLALNGPYADLGTFHDVIHGHKATSKLKVQFSIDQYTYEYHYRYRPKKREIELVKSIIADDRGSSYEYASTKDGISQIFRSASTLAKLPTQLVRPRFYGFSIIMPIAMMNLEGQSEPIAAALSGLRTLILRSMGKLETSFSSFDSIGAFRSAPQRTYLYTGEAPEEVGRYGENSAQMIASMASSKDRNSAKVINNISAWFANSGASHGVEIRSLTNRHFELCIKDRTGSSNNIVDAGFGCSQVLPVIVGGYRLDQFRRPPGFPIYVVQEPEIHLHPSAAAHLGTYFVDLARKGVQCFVETHSENIILRVARHVAAGHLSPDDVRIYWISDTFSGREVTRLGFHPDGSFSINWPEGFFPTRANETLDLARIASGIKSSDQLELTF